MMVCMMVMMMCVTMSVSMIVATIFVGVAVSGSLLTIFATRFMSPQVVESRKLPSATKMLVLTFHMLVLWSVTRHMTTEITPFCIQPLMTYRTMSAIRTCMTCEVIISNLLVHE